MASGWYNSGLRDVADLDTMTATYNEIDEYAAQWIGNLIVADNIDMFMAS